MNNYLKKLCSVFALSSMITTNSINAYEYEEDHHPNNSQAIPPPQHHPGEDALTFRLGADFTFWVPYQELNPAYTLDAPSTKRGEVVYPRFNGRPGFKVNAGANVHHDGWRVNASYTWFNNPEKLYQPKNLAGTSYFVLTNTSTVAANPAEPMMLQFSNWFNRIDASVDRSCYVGHYLAFRPWMGILAAWDAQDYDRKYTKSTTNEEANLDIHNEWWGIGPWAGVDSTYYFMDEIGLFLSSGGAILLGNHDYRRTDVTLDTASSSGTKTTQVLKSSLDSVEPMVETSLGLRWDSVWTDWAMRIEVAWELQTYFKQDLYFINDIRGNYSMQGLTAGVHIDF